MILQYSAYHFKLWNREELERRVIIRSKIAILVCEHLSRVLSNPSIVPNGSQLESMCEENVHEVYESHLPKLKALAI